MVDDVSPERKLSATRECISYLDIMAHDLLNFNQAVLGYLELVSSKKMLEGDNKRYVESAIEQVRNSSQLIEDIQKMTRLGMLEEREIGDVNLTRVIDESISDIELLYPDKKIKIDFRKEDEEVYVKGTDFLYDVIINILTNSVKFSGSDKVSIDVSFSRPEAAERLVDTIVEDHGIGIPDKVKDALMGNRESDAKSRRARGFGLVFVRAIADHFGGSLILDDRVSGDHTKGTRIVLRLPEVLHR